MNNQPDLSKLTAVLLPTNQISKRGDLLINGPGKLVIVDYDDSVACGVFLYLCSQEEIKKWNWYYSLRFKDVQKSVNGEMVKGDYNDCRKILFTNDPKLIADGVNALTEKALTYTGDFGQFKGIEVNFLSYFCEWYNKKQSTNVKEVDVEKLAKEKYLNWDKFKDIKASMDIWISGYNQALQSNAGGYSLEDMRKLLEFINDNEYSSDINNGTGKWFTKSPTGECTYYSHKLVIEKYIQSLTPKPQEETDMYLIDGNIHFKS